MLQPKQFDRVFNVVIDPDDFEIDVVETKKVALGAQALDSLVQQGELIAIDSSTPEKQGFETTAMKYSSRQKTANDVTFEKYIVSVESFDDDGV